MEQPQTNTSLPHEDEVEAEARSGTTFFGRLFKVARCERRHFYYTSAIFFAVSFIYSVGQPVKDAIVQNDLDASSLSPLKMYVVMPTVLLSVFVVNKLLITKNASEIFSKSLLGFSGIFILYGLVLRPFRSYLELPLFFTRDWYSDGKMAFIGLDGFGGFTLVINSWISALIYLVFELWASLIFQYLLYCVLNEIYSPQQSLRLTPLQLVFANLALIGASGVSSLLSHLLTTQSYMVGQVIRNGTIVTLGVISLGIHFLHKYFQTYVQPLPMFMAPVEVKKKKIKSSPGFIEGLKVLAMSKLVIAMSTIVIVYNISVALCDFTFKSCIKKYAVESNLIVDAHVYNVVSIQQSMIAVIAIIILLSPFSNLIRQKGFRAVAIVPVIVATIGMTILFGLSAYNTGGIEKIPIIGAKFPKPEVPLLALEQTAGLIITSAFKIVKYTALDLSKEALSMKISRHYRARFKSVYDGLCGKLGKASGSAISQIETVVFNASDIRDVAQLTFLVVGSLAFAWYFSVEYLGKSYDKAVNNNTDVDVGLFSGKSLE